MCVGGGGGLGAFHQAPLLLEELGVKSYNYSQTSVWATVFSHAGTQRMWVICLNNPAQFMLPLCNTSITNIYEIPQPTVVNQSLGHHGFDNLSHS